MTPRQQKFVELYLENGNAHQSYIEAGYAKPATRNATDVNACKVLRNSSVQAALSVRQAEILEASTIKIESKRILLWEIAQKASGRFDHDDESFKPDFKAAVAAINELNRMDGHHRDPKLMIKTDSFTFDAEILPPDTEDPVETIEPDETMELDGIVQKTG